MQGSIWGLDFVGRGSVAIFEPSESGYEAFLKQFWGPSRCGVTGRFLGQETVLVAHDPST